MTKWIRTTILFFFSFETFFVLFLFAGRIKADPRFSWVPIDLTLLLLLISLLYGLGIFIKQGMRIDRSSFLFILIYFAFLTYILASYGWSPSTAYAQQKLLLLATATFWIVFSCSVIIGGSWDRLRRLMLAFFLFSLWFVLEGLIVRAVSGPSSFIMIGGNYLGFGRIVGIGAIVILGFFYFLVRKRSYRILLMFLLLLFLYMLLQGGGRGPLIATAASLLVPIIIGLRFKGNDILIKKFALGLTLFSLAGFVFAVQAIIKNPSSNLTLYRLSLLFRNGDIGDSASARLQHFENAWNLFKEKPFFGHGIGSWPIINGFEDQRSYPHNLFLELGVETGLTGVVLFSILMTYAIFKLFPLRRIRDNNVYLVVTMLIINAFLNAMVSGDITDNRYLFGFLGLAVALKGGYERYKAREMLNEKNYDR